MRVARYWSPAGGPASRTENADSRVAHLAADLNPLAGSGGSSSRDTDGTSSGARFARTLIETDLFDAVDRLGYRESPSMRFAAIARLRDLAFYDGGEGDLPLFARVSHHLAASLRFEESPEMRRRIADALGEIAERLSEGGSAEQVSVFLRDVADANRSALRGFLETLGLYFAHRPRVAEGESDTDVVRFLAEVTEFAPEESGLHCILDMADDPVCIQASRFAGFASREETPRRVQVTTRSDEGIDEVWREGERLKACVAPLIAGMRAASQAGLPIVVPGVFLTGGNLSGIDLHTGDLSQTYLQGVSLAKSDVTHADLRGACLAGAALSGVLAFDRNDPETLGDFTDTDWWNAAPDSWFGEAGASLRQLLHRRFPPPASLRNSISGVGATDAPRPADRIGGKTGGRNAPRRTARTLFESGPAGETPGLLRDSTSR